MLVSSVLENALKRYFLTQGGNLRSIFLSRQTYQGAAIHHFEKQKDYRFRNYELLRVLINNKGIIGNDIETNIRFYKVIRVIPQKYYVQIYKNQ